MAARNWASAAESGLIKSSCPVASAASTFAALLAATSKSGAAAIRRAFASLVAWSLAAASGVGFGSIVVGSDAIMSCQAFIFPA